MSLKRFACLATFTLLAAISLRAGDHNGNNNNGDDGGDRDPRKHHHHRPVAAPEPASLLLLGTGLIGVAAKMRKKPAAV